MSETILVVDDDPGFSVVMAGLLQQAGFQAISVNSGADALDYLNRQWFDLVLTDLAMPGLTGLDLLRQLKVRYPDVPVVFLSAEGTVRVAVEALHLGAVDFIEKPIDRDALIHVVKRALALGAPTAKASMEGEISQFNALPSLNRIASSKSPVLILGETGTGKTRLARQIHDRSPRREQPFIVLDCAALPESLMESELFGHVRGAFTGADRDRQGAVRQANGGTLFLDEIGDLPCSLQMKLLRFVQEREIRPIGADSATKVDVRIVAATKHDLRQRVEEQKFRDDLYYRLSVVPIKLPPLRENTDMVKELAKSILAKVAKEEQRTMIFDSSALDVLQKHSWPGNIRELQNIIHRLVLLCEHNEIDGAYVRNYLEGEWGWNPRETNTSGVDLEKRRRDAERDAIKQALDAVGGNKTRAAQLLGIARRTLYRKIQELSLEPNLGGS